MCLFLLGLFSLDSFEVREKKMEQILKRKVQSSDHGRPLLCSIVIITGKPAVCHRSRITGFKLTSFSVVDIDLSIGFSEKVMFAIVSKGCTNTTGYTGKSFIDTFGWFFRFVAESTFMKTKEKITF